MASLAADGFQRMALAQLPKLRWIHLASGVDEVHPGSHARCGSVTSIAGYTEWAGKAEGALLSLGWDWRLDWLDHRDVACVRYGLPRSNIMLVDTRNRDFGWDRNLAALAQLVDTLQWSAQTCRAVHMLA